MRYTGFAAAIPPVDESCNDRHLMMLLPDGTLDNVAIMSNKDLTSINETAHWTRIPERQQVKARILAAEKDSRLCKITGTMLLSVIASELVKYNADPQQYATMDTGAGEIFDTPRSRDGLVAHWTSLPLPAQKSVKMLAKAKGIHLSEFTGILLTKMIDEWFTQFLAEQNGLESKSH